MTRSGLVPIGVGAVVGFFSGMTGVGGGAMLVSLKVSFMGLTQHRAHGTSLAVITSVSLAAAVSYALPFLLGYPAKFQYDPDLAKQLIPTLAMASMFGVVLGAKIMTALPARQLRRLFGVFLFFVAMSMFARGIQVGSGPTEVNIWPFPAWVALGFIAGVFSGVLGIGGALVMVPVMTIGAGIEQHMTQGVTLAVICITSMTGAFTHYRLGNVDLKATLAIAPAAVICGFLAGQLAAQIDTVWLIRVFGLAMFCFGYQFTFTGAPQPRTAPSPAPQRS